MCFVGELGFPWIGLFKESTKLYRPEGKRWQEPHTWSWCCVHLLFRFYFHWRSDFPSKEELFHFHLLWYFQVSCVTFFFYTVLTSKKCHCNVCLASHQKLWFEKHLCCHCWSLVISATSNLEVAMILCNQPSSLQGLSADLISYNAVMNAFEKGQQWQRALEMLDAMLLWPKTQLATSREICVFVDCCFDTMILWQFHNMKTARVQLLQTSIFGNQDMTTSLKKTTGFLRGFHQRAKIHTACLLNLGLEYEHLCLYILFQFDDTCISICCMILIICTYVYPCKINLGGIIACDRL